MKNKRLAIITTHPIQYYAPLFRLLSNQDSGFTIKVFYTLSQAQNKMHDSEFGLYFEWDIPLLEGYEYMFVNNIAKNPDTRHFKGIINPGLNRKIQNWKAEAILIYGWAFVSHLKALQYFHNKIPILFRGDSNLLNEHKGLSFKKIWRRIFLRWVYSHVDYALYVGEANKKYFLAHGLKFNQLVFCPHSVDNNRFTDNEINAKNKAKILRSNMKIEDDNCVFLFAGKLTKNKNAELLIKALLALDDKNNKLIIVGNGEMETELKVRYRECPNIFFMPFQNQTMMPIVYRLGNVFVLPSKGDTWGLSVNEAMCCKLAIIVSDKCGCAANLVEENKNGYIFKSGNIESLKNCMRLSLSNYKQFGAKSFRIIQNYTYAHTYNQLKYMADRNCF